jgi:hypothetical protein
MHQVTDQMARFPCSDCPTAGIPSFRLLHAIPTSTPLLSPLVYLLFLMGTRVEASKPRVADVVSNHYFRVCRDWENKVEESRSTEPCVRDTE